MLERLMRDIVIPDLVIKQTEEAFDEIIRDYIDDSWGIEVVNAAKKSDVKE